MPKITEIMNCFNAKNRFSAIFSKISVVLLSEGGGGGGGWVLITVDYGGGRG